MLLKLHLFRLYSEISAGKVEKIILKDNLLSAIVKEYKFDSVQTFYKELNAAEKGNRDYKAARTEWEKIYGDKTADSMGIRDGLRSVYKQ